MRKKIINAKKGFTLIEIMVAIGIIGILAAVVLVSMQSFAAKGRSAKALGQLSSAIPSMVSCWGNGGNVRDPARTGGNNICSLDPRTNPSYGTWPVTSTGDLANYSYNVPHSGIGVKNSWTFSLDSNSTYDDVTICCNSAMNSCKIISPSNPGSCTSISPTN